MTNTQNTQDINVLIEWVEKLRDAHHAVSKAQRDYDDTQYHMTAATERQALANKEYKEFLGIFPESGMIQK